MEELLYMLLRGIVIGVVVSAPMGPVGIFCIQRTLDKGRMSGFYTGVGAAISDLIYCLLTGFGLSFIEEFINRHRSPIQLLGSIVLIFFGIWLIRKKPDGSIAADPDHDAPSREGDILKGFALTFSNPLILFLIIGLFAQFNFVIEGIKFYHYVLGFIGIIAGALGWWWLVTHFVDKLRGHFNQRTMKLINMVIGIIILIFAAVGIFSSATSLIAAPHRSNPADISSMSASFRVADPSMKGWCADFPGEEGRSLRLEVAPVRESDPFGDSEVDALSVKVSEYPAGVVLSEITVSSGIDPYKGKNSWRIIRSGDVWTLFAGNREYTSLFSFRSSLVMRSGPEIAAASSAPVSVSDYSFDMASPEEMSFFSVEDINAALERLNNSGVYSDGSSKHLPGIYSLLDYEQDDSYALLGGQYRLAVLPSDSTGHFDLYYIDGAKANSSLWTPGMKKGRLKPTPFADIYDVEWRDAEGIWMRHDVQAEHDPLAHIITVRFPYQNSSMRFRRLSR